MFNKKVLVTIALVLVLFVSGLLGFVIIPNAVGAFRAASAMKDNSLNSVSGNGGSAVMVGEYLYFTSGYVSKNDYAYKQNDYNKAKHEGDGGIWRVKMPNGTPEYDNSYLNYLDDWNDFKDMSRFDPLQKYSDALDYVIKKGDLQLIVPKIAGWENTAIWVFGNTLIYTSPNNQKDKHGQLQRNKIDFFSCNLNGTNNKKIYTTQTDSLSSDNYTVSYADGKSYLLVKDGSNLFVVNTRGGAKKITDKCDSAVFPVVTGYFQGVDLSDNGQPTLTDDTFNLKNSYSGVMGYIYYTQARISDTNDKNYETMKGNSLWRVDIATGKTEKLWQDNRTNTLLALGNGHLILQVSHDQDATVAKTTEIYCIDRTIAANEFAASVLNTSFLMLNKAFESEETLYLSGEYTLPGQFRCITKTSSGSLLSYAKQGNAYVVAPIDKATDVDTIIAVNSGNILYKDTNGNYSMISYQAPNETVKDTVPIPDAVSGARITAFRVLNSFGQGGSVGYMFFSVKNFTEVDDNGSDTINVGKITAFGGKTYTLARLDKKYINLPENVDLDE